MQKVAAVFVICQSRQKTQSKNPHTVCFRALSALTSCKMAHFRASFVPWYISWQQHSKRLLFCYDNQNMMKFVISFCILDEHALAVQLHMRGCHYTCWIAKEKPHHGACHGLSSLVSHPISKKSFLGYPGAVSFLKASLNVT